MRCSGTPSALASIHAALLARFNITTGDGSRFLGMDSHYDLDAGILSLGMDTYIQSTMDRFDNFDLTLGCPYREIVGCLLWIVLCVLGPDLVRVKDLAKRCNAPTPDDYAAALKVLNRIYKRRGAVMLFKRGFAGRELVPSQSRPQSDAPTSLLAASFCPVPLPSSEPELAPTSFASTGPLEHLEYDFDIDAIDDNDPILPVTDRFVRI
jgi:hypothetical protein